MGRAKAACTGKAGEKREFITTSHWQANVLLLLGKRTFALVEKTNAVTTNIASQNHRTTDWLGLGGASKVI